MVWFWKKRKIQRVQLTEREQELLERELLESNTHAMPSNIETGILEDSGGNNGTWKTNPSNATSALDRLARPLSRDPQPRPNAEKDNRN